MLCLSRFLVVLSLLAASSLYAMVRPFFRIGNIFIGSQGLNLTTDLICINTILQVPNGLRNVIKYSILCA